MKAFKQKCSLLLVLAMLLSLLPLSPFADGKSTTAYAAGLESIPTTGLDLWLKADEGVTADAAGKVSVWADQSGQNNHVTQGTAGAYPTYVTDAVYGKPAIRFTGNPKTFLSTTLAKPWTGSSTVIMVMKVNNLSQTGARGIFSNDVGSNVGAWSIVTSSNTPQRLMVLGPRDGGTSSGNLEVESTLDPITLTVTMDTYAGTMKSYRNGVAAPVVTNASFKNFSSFKTYVIGKSYSTSNLHMAADVSEVLVYKGVLSDADRSAVESYLARKYYAVSPVAASVASGAVMPGSSVSLSSPTAGAAIYYTLDGSDPLSSGTRTLYASPITISGSTTIKASAHVQGLVDSTVATYTYTLASKLEPVKASVPSGNVSSGTTIILTSNPGASIFYTMDGTDPKTSSSKLRYSAPIPINSTSTIRTYASQDGISDSDTAAFTYAVMPVQSVTASQKSGIYFSGTQLTLSTSTIGASIYYTVDGTDPTTSSTRVLYTSPIELTGAIILKAYASKNGTTDSPVAQNEYTIYSPTTTVTNLPDSYYNRPGLENMPHLNYQAMKVANVKDFGAVGDGETSDMDAFDKAIAALSAVGGGVVYVPKGFYYFPFDLTDPANRWAYKRNYNNIHFIGEGDDSVIRFKLPGIPSLPSGRTWTTRNGVFSGFSYGWRIDGNDISYKDLAFSWYPRYDSRGGAGGYTVATTGDNIQMNRVSIDQGNIGAVFWQNAKNVYVVDTKVRNTAADSIHFANVANVVAAYNFVDGANDDSIASIDDKGYNVADNHQYLYNTILNSYWGRGITVTGTNHRVEGNWLENIKSSGVYTNNGGQSSVSGNGHDTEHVLIKDNTIVRSGLMGLIDNQKGAIAFNQYKDDLMVENNRVYGGQSYGIYFNPWGPASNVSNVHIRNNEIAAVAGHAIVLNSNVSMQNMEITDNDMFGNGGSVNFNAAALSGTIQFANNKVSQPVSNAVYQSGFPIVPDQPVYTNPYAAVAAEPSETGWAGAPAVETAANEINVKDYGAKGDGATNDLLAFYEAMNAIPASGGTLRIPTGTYVLTPDPSKESVPYSKITHHLLLVGRSNVHIVGDGDSSVLRFTSADHFGLRLMNMTNSSVRSVKLELANKPFQRHNRSLLDITGSHGIVVEHVTVANSGGSGIQVDASTGVSIQGCTVTGSNMSGILLLASRQVYVENSTLKGNRDHAIFLNKQGSIARVSEFIRIANNDIDGEGNSEQSGIAFASGDNVLATGNRISNTHMAGILFYYTSEVYPTDRITVTGNTLVHTNTGSNTLTYGAISSMMSKGGNFIIAENTIQSTPYSGIWVKDSTLKSLKLTGNTFIDTATAGGSLIDIDSDQLKNIGQYTANSDEISVQTKPERMSTDSGWGIAVTIQNVLSLLPSAGGKISITSPAEWALASASANFASIAPGQSTTVIVPVPAPLSVNTGAIPFTLKIDQNGKKTNVSKTVNFLASSKAANPPVIDGTASEWSDAGTVVLNQASQVQFQQADWAGVDDLSATGYVKHDDKNLYFSVVVKDNIQAQTNSGSDIWRGDSLQMAIDAGRATAVGQSGYASELVFALGADKQPAQWRTTAPSGKTTGQQFNSAVAVERDETKKTTTYEIALPWEEILPNAMKEIPARIGFSFLINDDDGTGRRGWMSYMDGIASSKNPSLYGDLLLLNPDVKPPIPPTPPATGNPTSYGGGGGTTATLTGTIEATDAGIVVLPSNSDKVTEQSDGYAIRRVTLRDGLLQKALDQLVKSKDAMKKLLLKETENSGLQVELSGKAAASIQQIKDTVISLTVGKNAVEVPSYLFDVEQIAKEWQVKPEDLLVKLSLKPLSPSDSKQLEEQAMSSGFTLAGDALRFEMIVTSGNRQQQIGDKNNTNLLQRMTIPGTPDFNKLTGIVIDRVTGEAVFAPTTFTIDNGQTVAVVRSNGSGITAIVQADKQFADMAKHWAEGDVNLLASKLLIKGVTAAEFEPEAPVTRVQLAVMLSRALGLAQNPNTSLSFGDVTQSDWFYNQIAASLQAGLLEGYEDGTLKPNDPVTREQMAVMIARALHFMHKETQIANSRAEQILARFGDKAAMDDWAAEAIVQCVEAGIMQGITESDFGASEGATRAQAAVTLVRFLKVSQLIN